MANSWLDTLPDRYRNSLFKELAPRLDEDEAKGYSMAKSMVVAIEEQYEPARRFRNQDYLMVFESLQGDAEVSEARLLRAVKKHVKTKRSRSRGTPTESNKAQTSSSKRSKAMNQDPKAVLNDILSRSSRKFQKKPHRKPKSRLGKLQAEKEAKRASNIPGSPSALIRAVNGQFKESEQPALRSIVAAARWVARNNRPVTPHNVANRIHDLRRGSAREITIPMGGKPDR